MTRCYVVTEGRSDVVLLTELLKPAFDPAKGELVVASGNGYSGADSLARSILVSRRHPVALVVDADSRDPDERREFLETLLRRYASPDAWRVFVIVPEIERVLFTDPVVLEQLVQRMVPPDQLVRAEYEPKRVLEELLGGTSRAEAFEQRLPQIDLTPLRAVPWVQDLQAFVERFVGRLPLGAAA